MFDFRIMIAEIPFRVRCLHQQTFNFLRPYETDAEPLFTLEPAEEDLLRMREEMILTAKKEGHACTQFSDSYVEQNAVHALLAEQLVHHGVLLMHGSALSMDGEAYVFTGRSGSGKSTHARLWREAFGDRVWMINDDKPVLRIRPDGITVWGTPWDGKHHLSRNAGAPLKAIVQIRQAAENRIFPLSKAEAFPLLVRQTYSSPDPATGMEILALQRQMLHGVSFYTLECNQDPEAAGIALEGMNGGICHR